MEGLLALGTVSSLITIVDKGIELVSEIKEIYRGETGTAATHQRIDKAAAELESNCNIAKAFLEDDQDSLITRATTAAEKLRKILSEFQAGPRKRDAVLKTIKSRWKRNEVEELKQEIAECQQLLQSRLVVLMAAKTLSGTDPQATQDPTQDHKATLEELANTLKNALWYPEIHSREERIVKAHNQTFRWVFEDPSDAQKTSWDSFTDWLQQGKGIYWVQGKAGSGKSTLIKFVKDEARTAQALEDWAQLTDLVTASFFFWNSGSPLQKSLEGLYRSLLYQILSKSPRTVEIMFEASELAQIKGLVLPANRDSFWSEEKLARALRRLASSPSQFESYCFFIDGLDEFDSKKRDHDDLVDVLEELSSAKHIKICLSSRPLPVFVECFADCPALRLQDLTAGDIRIYVDDELKGSRKGRKFVDNKPKDFKSIVNLVADKASGVFLWVYLVVRALQQGLRHGDTVDELKTRIDDSPEDLLPLFHKMVSKLEPRYKAQGARIFRTVFAAPDMDKVQSNHSPAVSIVDLFLAADENIFLKTLARFSGRTKWDTFIEKVNEFEQRVNTTCCGLLEFSRGKGSYRGEWLEKIMPEITPMIRTSPRLLHQSVKEFLEEQNTVGDFSIQPQFEDYERLLAGRIFAVKSMLSPEMSNATIHELADYALAMALHMEEQTGRTSPALIEELWRACCATATLNTDRKNWLSTQTFSGKHIIRALRSSDLMSDVDETPENDAFLDEFNLTAYAITCGLYKYASEKVDADPSIVRNAVGVPLLNVAMLIDTTKTEETIRSTGWQNLIRKLVENGADPNLVHHGFSPWRRRLDIQAEEKDMKLLGTIPEDLRVMVEHGADINQTIHYKGLLGPMSRIDDQTVLNDQFDRFDETITLDGHPQTAESGTQSASAASENSQTKLYRMLQEALDKRGQKRKEQKSDESNESENTESDTFDSCFFYIFGKIIALQRNSFMAHEGHAVEVDWTEADDAAIQMFPIWGISLLQWVDECCIQTNEVKTFRKMLVEKGAKTTEPKIVHFVAQKGNIMDIKDKDDAQKRVDGDEEDDDRNWSFAVKEVSLDQSGPLTEAFLKVFPDYKIAGFPRELHRLLSLVNDRVNAPLTLGPQGSMPVDIVVNGMLEILAAGLVPTTGLRIHGHQLESMTEACMRLIGALEAMLRFGNRLDEVGGLGGLMGIAGPEELQEEMFWGESQACCVM